jgi:UDP-N-acetylmuramoyl-tripeptide--D-alanyl-D-alanine ligase
MTPGSFNTTLGVIRTIREYLKPYHEVFIVEMGAKQVGDIREICELVHPSMGIITAVGEQHLESFGCIENVQRTKFELVDALPADGLAVLNDDFKYIRERKVDNVRAVRYGNNAEYNVLSTRYADDGTHFTVGNNAGWSLDLRTQLVGKYNLSNTLAGCIIARELGLSDDEIRIAVADIQQVEHRLSIRRAGGLTIIDDAFNSNPHGSAMALEVLATFTAGKRIVITPGMIELGAGQREHNRILGRNMAASCDVAIVVGEFNRDAIVTGLVDEGFPAEQTIVVASFAEATAKLREIAAPGDTVLYENDLPDTFK